MELISKKKLLETIEPMVGKFDDDGEFWWSRESILRAINNALIVEERGEGYWINDTNYSGWTCTNCGYHEGNAVDNYCPNCGAKMKGE